MLGSWHNKEPCCPCSVTKIPLCQFRCSPQKHSDFWGLWKVGTPSTLIIRPKYWGAFLCKYKLNSTKSFRNCYFKTMKIKCLIVSVSQCLYLFCFQYRLPVCQAEKENIQNGLQSKAPVVSGQHQKFQAVLSAVPEFSSARLSLRQKVVWNPKWRDIFPWGHLFCWR